MRIFRGGLSLSIGDRLKFRVNVYHEVAPTELICMPREGLLQARYLKPS
jgi:hypothetical protein